VPRDKKSFKLSVLQWGKYICHIQDKGILHHTCLLIQNLNPICSSRLSARKTTGGKKEQPTEAQ
jgi:hypothetical protein